MTDKLTHSEVEFEHPAKGPRHCFGCKHYQIVGCDIVQNPIFPWDWCNKHEKLVLFPVAKSA